MTVCEDGQEVCAEIQGPEPEVCDGLDNDCNGVDDDVAASAEGAVQVYADLDEDGFGDGDAPFVACEVSPGSSELAGDCDDEDDTINLDATEIWYDGVDQDCDTLFQGYFFSKPTRADDLGDWLIKLG